jgi:hypothetical protein
MKPVSYPSEQFDNEVFKAIRDSGAYADYIRGVLYYIEVDSYFPDGSHDGYVGWFAHDYRKSYLGDSPFNVYCQLEISSR